jgi:hypothetical protein
MEDGSLRKNSATETYWLSFANEKEFGGVIIVDVDGPFGILAAIRKTIEMGINPGPGYSVKGMQVPGDAAPANFKNRLLDAAEVRRLEGGLE